jgi:hypothetical protein
MAESKQPTHGFTRQGLAVHGRTQAHLPEDTTYQRINKKVAIFLTENVGTMTCFWLFCLLSLVCLPSVLFAMGILHKHSLFPAFMLTFGFELLMTWFISTTIQVILLPAIMVGQNIQSAASDARSAKQFEDTEAVKADMELALDRLDTETVGGLKAVLDRINELEAALASAIGSKPNEARATES